MLESWLARLIDWFVHFLIPQSLNFFSKIDSVNFKIKIMKESIQMKNEGKEA